MGGAAVDVLYRLRAEDIAYRLHDALLLVGRWDTALFSERGRINLNTLAAPEARAIHPTPTDTEVTVTYDKVAQEPAVDPLRVQRLSQSHPEGWLSAYRRACHRASGRTPARTASQWARSA
jgi:hypothetical protein